MNLEDFKKELEQFKNGTLDTIAIHPKVYNYMTKPRNRFITCIENSLWSWRNCIDFRFDKYEDNIDRCAFFEELNVGYYETYIYPYDDWYNPTISKERQLRLGQRPKPPCVALYKGLTGEYVAFVEGGYTICSQPDREKANSCLEYYKSQNPTAIFYGTWDDDLSS